MPKVRVYTTNNYQHEHEAGGWYLMRGGVLIVTHNSQQDDGTNISEQVACYASGQWAHLEMVPDPPAASPKQGEG